MDIDHHRTQLTNAISRAQDAGHSDATIDEVRRSGISDYAVAIDQVHEYSSRAAALWSYWENIDDTYGDLYLRDVASKAYRLELEIHTPDGLDFKRFKAKLLR